MYGDIIANFKLSDSYVSSLLLKEFHKEQNELFCTNKAPCEKPSIAQFSLFEKEPLKTCQPYQDYINTQSKA